MSKSEIAREAADRCFTECIQRTRVDPIADMASIIEQAIDEAVAEYKEACDLKSEAYHDMKELFEKQKQRADKAGAEDRKKHERQHTLTACESCVKGFRPRDMRGGK